MNNLQNVYDKDLELRKRKATIKLALTLLSTIILTTILLTY
jgi:hypothetical protein